MGRYIESKYSPSQLYCCSDPNNPLFGYHTSSHDCGVFVLIGTDHGQGIAQFLARLLLGDSETRRLAGRVDHQMRTISYATIKSRKDSYGILKMTSKETNDSIHML